MHMYTLLFHTYTLSITLAMSYLIVFLIKYLIPAIHGSFKIVNYYIKIIQFTFEALFIKF